MEDNTEQLVASNVADLNVEKKKRGNPTWGKGMQSPNPAGRPYNDDKEKKTNRALREKAFVQLLRKFAPHQSKAVMTAVRVMDNAEASDQNKLKASALIIGVYKDLLKDAYHKDYDTDQGEEIQDNSPAFSLRMLESSEKVA